MSGKSRTCARRVEGIKYRYLRLPLTADRSPCLVIQTAFLGDVVLTTPLLSALAERHGPVDVVTTPAAGSLLETHPAVRSVIRYDKHGRDRGISGLWKLSRELRSRRYSMVYLPHRSFRSAVLALLSGARERVGFAGTAASISYTRRVPRPEGGHEVERLLALPPAPSQRLTVSLGLTADDHRQAERWLERHAIAPGFVALAPGSIWGTKRWPYYADLVVRLGRPCVVIGSAADCDLADSIVTAAPTRAVSAAGALGLRAAASLISRAAVLVTNDSAPLHLATAVGTPVRGTVRPDCSGVRLRPAETGRFDARGGRRCHAVPARSTALRHAHWVTTGACVICRSKPWPRR